MLFYFYLDARALVIFSLSVFSDILTPINTFKFDEISSTLNMFVFLQIITIVTILFLPIQSCFLLEHPIDLLDTIHVVEVKLWTRIFSNKFSRRFKDLVWALVEVSIKQPRNIYHGSFCPRINKYLLLRSFGWNKIAYEVRMANDAYSCAHAHIAPICFHWSNVLADHAVCAIDFSAFPPVQEMPRTEDHGAGLTVKFKLLRGKMKWCKI